MSITATIPYTLETRSPHDSQLTALAVAVSFDGNIPNGCTTIVSVPVIAPS